MLISDIAEREHIPKRFLELILLELKNHGVLHIGTARAAALR
jgi:DNA-binding IscR family transcriptional regulator